MFSFAAFVGREILENGCLSLQYSENTVLWFFFMKQAYFLVTILLDKLSYRQNRKYTQQIINYFTGVPIVIVEIKFKVYHCK